MFYKKWNQHAGEHFRTYGKRVRERLVELSNSNRWPFPTNKVLLVKQKRLIEKYERGELQPYPPPEPELPDDLPVPSDEGEPFYVWAMKSAEAIN